MPREDFGPREENNRYQGIDPDELGTEICQMIDSDKARIICEKDEKGKIRSRSVVEIKGGRILFFEDPKRISELKEEGKI